jgi:hypothetical protein
VGVSVLEAKMKKNEEAVMQEIENLRMVSNGAE